VASTDTQIGIFKDDTSGNGTVNTVDTNEILGHVDVVSSGGGSVIQSAVNFTISTSNTLVDGVLPPVTEGDTIGSKIGDITVLDSSDAVVAGYSFAIKDQAGTAGSHFEVKNGVELWSIGSNPLDYEIDNVVEIILIGNDGSSDTEQTLSIAVENQLELVAATYLDKGLGAFDVNLTGSGVGQTSDNDTLALVSGSTWHNTTVTTGTGIDLSYSLNEGFKPTAYMLNSTQLNGIGTVSPVLENEIDAALGMVDSYTLLNFSQVTETENSDEVGQIRFGVTSDSATSFAYFPTHSPVDGSSFWKDGYNGDVFFESPEFNETSNYASRPVQEMNYFDSTIKHEIGHVLGLKHPFEDTHGYYEDDVVGMAKTVMSYSEYDGAPTSGGFNLTWAAPNTYMVNDIKALQYYYGVNEQTAAGDTTYSVSDLKNVNDIIYTTIWDANGTDTIDLTGWSGSGAIDMNEGQYSYFGGITSTADSNIPTMAAGQGVLGIAYGAMIENVKGGSDSDSIVGNSLANVLYGGAGSNVRDTLTGGTGADIFQINSTTDGTSSTLSAGPADNTQWGFAHSKDGILITMPTSVATAYSSNSQILGQDAVLIFQTEQNSTVVDILIPSSQIIQTGRDTFEVTDVESLLSSYRGSGTVSSLDLAYLPAGENAGTRLVDAGSLDIEILAFNGANFYGKTGLTVNSGKLVYDSGDVFVGDLNSNFLPTGNGSFYYGDGKVYHGEFNSSGAMNGTGMFLSPTTNDFRIWNGDQFDNGAISSNNLSDPEILELSYSAGYGLDITLAQDSSSDNGIYMTLGKLLFSGTSNGIESALTVPLSTIKMTNETKATLSDGTSIHNAVTFHVPVSSIAGIDNLSEIKVHYDLNGDGSGSSSDLAGMITLVDVARPDIINDFNVGEDKIEVTGSNVESIEWISSGGSDTIVRITSSGSELFLLDNLDSSTLSSSDFIFV
jgi:serralysin